MTYCVKMNKKQMQQFDHAARVLKRAIEYQPKTGAPCFCKRGVQRNNCPSCEGTGMMIDFARIRARAGE
jgi:hypothetical protein